MVMIGITGTQKKVLAALEGIAPTVRKYGANPPVAPAPVPRTNSGQVVAT